MPPEIAFTFNVGVTDRAIPPSTGMSCAGAASQTVFVCLELAVIAVPFEAVTFTFNRFPRSLVVEVYVELVGADVGAVHACVLGVGGDTRRAERARVHGNLIDRPLDSSSPAAERPMYADVDAESTSPTDAVVD